MDKNIGEEMSSKMYIEEVAIKALKNMIGIDGVERAKKGYIVKNIVNSTISVEDKILELTSISTKLDDEVNVSIVNLSIMREIINGIEKATKINTRKLQREIKKTIERLKTGGI